MIYDEELSLRQSAKKFNEDLKKKSDVYCKQTPQETIQDDIHTQPWPSSDEIKEKGLPVLDRNNDVVSFIYPIGKDSNMFYVFDTVSDMKHKASFSDIRHNYQHLNRQPIRSMNEFYDGTTIGKEYLEEKATMFDRNKSRNKGTYVDGFLGAIKKDIEKRKNVKVSDSLIRATNQMDEIKAEINQSLSKVNPNIVANRTKIMSEKLKPCIKNYKRLNKDEQEDLYNIYEQLNLLKKHKNVHDLSNHESILFNIDSMLDSFKNLFNKIFKPSDNDEEDISQSNDDDSPSP